MTSRAYAQRIAESKSALDASARAKAAECFTPEGLRAAMRPAALTPEYAAELVREHSPRLKFRNIGGGVYSVIIGDRVTGYKVRKTGRGWEITYTPDSFAGMISGRFTTGGAAYKWRRLAGSVILQWLDFPEAAPMLQRGLSIAPGFVAPQIEKREIMKESK